MNVALEIGTRRAAFFTKTYELSLTRSYVSHWGMAQAVRELIQNALDSESPFCYEFAGDDGDTAVLSLTSEFTTLLPQTLLLGATSKLGQKDAIGSFGEGYKIALLVLTRLGYEVEMRNGGLLWKPRFRFSKLFGDEMLVIDERELPDRTNRGLTFVITGLSPQDVEEIRNSCLQMQDSIGQIKSTPFGDILLERPGALYVGGLFICSTELNYGYNIKPEHIKLERDRQTVDSWDLKRLTRDMWFATEEYDRIAEMIQKGFPDLEYAQFTSPEIVKEACFRLFQKENPGAIAAGSQAELDKLVAQGMTKTVFVGGNYYANLTTAPSYRTMNVPRIRTPTQHLEAWFEDAKYHMHDKIKGSFRKLVEESADWKVK